MAYFIEPCLSSGIDINVIDSYCVCALKEAMRRNPTPRDPVTAATDAGEDAGHHTNDFPDCPSG
jgi:hypothetical protein